MESPNPPNNAPSPTAIILMGFAILLIIAGVIFLSEVTSKPKKSIQGSDNSKSDKERTIKEKEILAKFFSEQEKGRSGEDLFCEKDLAVTFFSFREYKIVDDRDGMGITYTVRVDSSTKGGLPITKLYKIYIDEEKNCVGLIDEAQ